MPSTYSPQLRIELIANGEQSGTWGVTTNTNLGSIIESAISGLAAVTTSTANQALTALNGSPDQARNALLVLNTLVASNYNVYIPPVSKQYIVRNANSTHTVTIFCSTVLGNTTAAGSGVAIPPSKTAIIYADGANVRTGFDFLPFLVDVPAGGTGVSAFPVNSLVCSAPTTTGTLRTFAYGTSGQLLISAGANTLPSWTNALPDATTATTRAEKTAGTSIATTAFVDRLRSLSTSATVAAGGTAVIGDRGALLSVTGGVTIPASVFAANDVFTIYNNSASTITLTQGAGMTLRLVGTAETGNRTLAQRGLATVVFIGPSEAVVSGGGLL
jgi:hypothetical protein